MFRLYQSATRSPRKSFSKSGTIRRCNSNSACGLIITREPPGFSSIGSFKYARLWPGSNADGEMVGFWIGVCVCTSSQSKATTPADNRKRMGGEIEELRKNSRTAQKANSVDRVATLESVVAQSSGNNG